MLSQNLGASRFVTRTLSLTKMLNDLLWWIRLLVTCCFWCESKVEVVAVLYQYTVSLCVCVHLRVIGKYLLEFTVCCFVYKPGSTC